VLNAERTATEENAQSSADMVYPGNRQLYTKEEVIRHFEGLLPSLDLKQEIAALGYGLNSIFKKGRSLVEFNAVCIALWKLALDSSFPAESNEFFADFLNHSPLLGTGKKKDKLVARVKIYCDMLAIKKTDDFTPVSQCMADNLMNSADNNKALQLTLSLTMRKLYQVIFDHLI